MIRIAVPETLVYISIFKILSRISRLETLSEPEPYEDCKHSSCYKFQVFVIQIDQAEDDVRK